MDSLSGCKVVHIDSRRRIAEAIAAEKSVQKR